MKITEPGVYTLADVNEYHADPCVVPSLSSSIAKILIRQSPLHAWTQHARFGGEEMQATRLMDTGSALHAMMLGYAEKVKRIKATFGPKTKRKELIGLPVTGYQSTEAQEERDLIREYGDIPVLSSEWQLLTRAQTAAREQIGLADDGPAFFGPGRSEAVVVAKDGDVWLRCMIDRLPDDHNAPPYDLKATSLSASPGEWERRLQREYAFQDAFYRRVIRLAGGYDPKPMRFIVVELEPPFGVVIHAAAKTLAETAEREVGRAILRWSECTKANKWPGYPKHTAWVEASMWQMNAEDEAQQRDDFMRKNDPIV